MEIPKRIVLDTTILIEHLRNKSDVINKLENAELATTVINAFELYFGAFKSKKVEKNLTAAKGLLSTLDLLYITDSSAEKAGRILAELQTKGKHMEIRDLFIGSIALEEGFSILTHNKQHFERIPELHIIVPSDVNFQ
ncbi:MAG: type II toxin-antitoxin system VapC family toxin [Candidatus Hydrothermarchaeota archaeon]|nr:type II toxin-antitoxin system VapC family toxin [Candidatus Hydrothermarchaeota archaeon]